MGHAALLKWVMSPPPQNLTLTLPSAWKCLFRSVPTRHVIPTLSLNIVLVTVLLVTKYLTRNGVRNWGELTFEGAVPRAGEDNEIRIALGRSASREGNIWLSVFSFSFVQSGTPADRMCRYSQVFPTSVNLLWKGPHSHSQIVS